MRCERVKLEMSDKSRRRVVSRARSKLGIIAPRIYYRETGITTIVYIVGMNGVKARLVLQEVAGEWHVIDAIVCREAG